MTDTIHVRGEGGAVWEMDLPLRTDHAKRLAGGQLQRVNADGTPYVAETTTEPDDPGANLDPDLGAGPVDDQGDPDVDDDADDPDVDPDIPPELQAFLNTPPPPVVVKPAPAKKATKAAK